MASGLIIEFTKIIQNSKMTERESPNSFQWSATGNESNDGLGYQQELIEAFEVHDAVYTQAIMKALGKTHKSHDYQTHRYSSDMSHSL